MKSATFRDLRECLDAVLVASGVPNRDVQTRIRHETLALTLDSYGFAREAGWENAPASFEELFGIPAPRTFAGCSISSDGWSCVHRRSFTLLGGADRVSASL